MTEYIPWLITIILLREMVSELAQLLYLKGLNKLCKIPSFFCCIVKPLIPVNTWGVTEWIKDYGKTVLKGKMAI